MALMAHKKNHTHDNWVDGIVFKIIPLFKWETFIKLVGVFSSSNQK